LPSQSRLRTLFRSPEPRFPGDLFAVIGKDATEAFARGLACYVVTLVLGLALVVVGHPSLLFVLGLLIAIFVPVWALGRWLNTWQGGRGRALRELQLAWADLTLQEWQQLGVEQPHGVDEALAVLADRTDDLAVALRVSCLRIERPGAARELIDSWHPVEPEFRARRERVLSALRFDEDGTDDLGAATTAAGEITDPAKRETAKALLALEHARRVQVRGGNPIPLLLEIRQALGPLDLDEIQESIAASASISRLRAQVLGCLFPVAHFIIVLVLARLLISLTGS
jgi:hypothetical protein